MEFARSGDFERFFPPRHKIQMFSESGPAQRACHANAVTGFCPRPPNRLMFRRATKHRHVDGERLFAFPARNVTTNELTTEFAPGKNNTGMKLLKLFGTEAFG